MADEIQRLEDVLSFYVPDFFSTPLFVSIETDSLTLMEQTIRVYFRQQKISFTPYFFTLNEKPYEPFLSFLKDSLTRLSQDERESLFASLHLSHFSKQILQSFFAGAEEAFSFYLWYYDPEECFFFQKEIINGLLSLLISLAKTHPYILIVRCVASASFAFFDFLSRILSLSQPHFRVIFLMDLRLLTGLPEEQSYEWNLFFHRAEKSLLKCVFRFSDTAFEESDQTVSATSVAHLYPLMLTYQKHWAWRDAKATAQQLLKQEYLLLPDQRKQTLLILTISLAMENSPDEALYYGERLLSLFQEANEIKNILFLQRLLGYFYLVRDSGRENALKIARQNLRLATESKAREDILLASVLLFACGDILEDAFSHFFAKTLPQIKRFHPLIYFFVTSNYYFALLLPRVFLNQAIISFLKKNANLAKKHSHIYRLSFYFHNLAIFYSRLPDFSKTVTFYKKSIRIRQKLGDNRRLSHVYNGFGYVYFSAENFSKAHFYYNKAAQLNVQLRDYHELCMTLMNMVQLELVRHTYETAETLLTFLIDLKNQLGIETLPIHSNVKIKTLHTYLLEKLKRFVPYYHQMTQYNKASNLALFNKTQEEYAYEQWYMAMYYQRYIDSSRTLDAYREAISAISSSEFTYMELEIRYDFLQWITKNKPELYEKTRQEFLQRLEEQNLYHYKNYLLEKHVRSPRHMYHFPREHIIETARLRAQITQFQSTLEVLEFSNQLQRQLLRQKEKESLLIESLLLFRRYFLIDTLVCYLGSHHNHYQEWRLVYSSHEKHALPPDLYANIRACFTTGKDRLVVDLAANYMKLFFPQYYSVMYFPLFLEEKEVGCIFCANQRSFNAFSEHTFHTLQMATRQINTMLENLFYAEILHHTAQTDMLTGCANRFALQKRLEEEVERAKRDPEYNFSVIFTDMDNFKYYNDHFGHSAGDNILQEISVFFREHMRKVDLLGRFGGDEFIFVLPNTNHKKAYLLVQRIYQKMENTQFFSHLIRKYTHQDTIPPEKMLSISMGIADYSQADSLDQLLEYADIALYEAKSLGKNRAVVYKEK